MSISAPFIMQVPSFKAVLMKAMPYVDVLFGCRVFESEDILGYTVVEAVFTYLDWKTSSVVGKVCVFVNCL